MALIFKGTGQVKRGLAADWTSANPTLASGEWGYEEDTGNVKIGDGTTAWISLPYFTGVSAVDSVNGYTGVVVLGTDDISEGATNKYNATHTGQVIGDEALTLRSEAITDQGLKGSITGGEFMLLEDGGTLYKQEITNIAPVRSVNGGVGAVTTPHYANTNLTATGSRTHTWAGFTLVENFVNGITNTFRGISALLIQSSINDGTDLSSFSQTKTYISSLIDSALGQNSITVRQDKIDIGLNSTSPLMINTSAGTSGQVLKSQGASLPPIWDSVSGAVDSVNGQTGVVVLDTDDISEGATNKYNATHTGQVDGSTVLTLRSEAISDQGVKSPITGSEYLLLEDGATLYKAEGNLFVDGSGAVMESDFSHSHSVLVQQGGTGSPETVNFSNNTILGKAGGGDLDALTATEVRTMINVADGAEVNTIDSITAGEPTGSDQVLNVVSLTQAEYDAGTPIATTLYIIV